jgi:hypothetical protein
MRALGGKVYRRAKHAVADDAWYDGFYPDRYLYPYEYIPPAYAY